MRTRCLVFALVLIAVLVAAGLAQRDTPAPSGNISKWDYGILKMARLSWVERGRIVEQRPGPDFAAALNAPYSNDSDIFEMNLLSSLGDQGWELACMPASGGTYVFKRPR